MADDVNALLAKVEEQAYKRGYRDGERDAKLLETELDFSNTIVVTPATGGGFSFGTPFTDVALKDIVKDETYSPVDQPVPLSDLKCRACGSWLRQINSKTLQCSNCLFYHAQGTVDDIRKQVSWECPQSACDATNICTLEAYSKLDRQLCASCGFVVYVL